MTDEQKVLYKALVKKGLWREAQGWKENRRQELRLQGLLGKQANTRAWDEMFARYAPIIGVDAGELEPIVVHVPAERKPKAEKPAPVEELQEPEEDGPEPTGTGKGFADDVHWVYEEFDAVVVERDGKQPTFRWAKATQPPPSRGSKALMRQAARAPTKFFGETVPKVLGNVDADADFIEEERKLIGDIRKVLKRFLEVTEPEEATQPDGQ